ncbi:MAG: MFS transporter [Rhodospirillaceae bacterium]|nr:MFS transporter [Rhodospirillaceae bacterium]MBT5455394.1 MFS transporter [Rhodospirillaceae bacterium]
MADAPGASHTPPSSSEIPAGAVYATYGVGFAGNGVAIMLKVIVPLWAIELHFSASQIGIAIGLSSLMPFLFSIHGGVLMDRLGARRVTIAYGLITVILCPLYPLFPFFAAVVVLQLFTGLGSSMVWVGAQSLIMRFTKGKTSLIARFSVAARTGTLLGPVAIGAIWDLAGPWGAFSFVGGAALLVLVALFMVPETKETAPTGDVSVKTGPVKTRPISARLWDLVPKWQDYAGAFSLIAIPAVAFVVAMTALRNSSTGIQTSFYIVYLEEIGFLGTLIGVLIGVSEGAGILGALMAGWWEKFFRPHWVLIGFVVVSLAFVSITPFLGSVFILLIIATTGRGFAQGLTQPVMFGVLARAVDSSVQGVSIGLRTTSNRLSAVLVPFVMGFVADMVGIENSFYVCGGFLIACCIVATLFIRRIPDFRT